MTSDAGTPKRAILHVDMDAFYASVEALENPELRGKPLIVGGDGERGVVASCSYEARAYGVKSAMPSSRAKRLCPQAIFVHGHFNRYRHYSEQMHAVFREYTPLIEGLSLDEAFLDVTGAQRLFGSPIKIAWDIRTKIKERTGLDCSVGVSTTKHVSKLASVVAKPTASKRGTIPGKGVVVVRDYEALDFLHALPVRALWGVGPKAGERLASIGVLTVKELAHVDEDRLRVAVGEASALHLKNLAWNRDDRDVVPEREAKSVGHEQTYPKDIVNRDEIHRQLVRQAEAVSARLRKHELAGRTVTVKLRFGDFRTITRSKSIPKHTANATTLTELADALVDKVDVSPGIRLIGISVSNLEVLDEPLQLEFGVEESQGSKDEQQDRRRALLDSVIDGIRDKYGDAAVVPGQLVTTEGADLLRHGDQQWGPQGRSDR